MSISIKHITWFFVVLLVLPFFVSAQNAGTDGLVITTSPSTPMANSQVTASVESNNYSNNLNGFNIVWYLNDKKLGEGVGLKSITFKTGPVGSTMNLSVSASYGSKTMTNGISFKVGSVSLLWKANSYIFPGYKGKALSAQGGTFKVVAIPEIDVNPKNLVYNWFQGDKLISEKSGYGKNVFYTVDSDYVYGGNEIKVNIVLPSNGATIMTNTVFIPQTEPKILFFKNDPTYGAMYNKEMNNSVSLSNSDGILAEPFYFSANKNSKDLKYAWVIDNKNISDKNYLSSGEIIGNSASLTVSSLSKMFQKVKGTINNLNATSDYNENSIYNEIISL